MQPSYAVIWREGDGPVFAGKLELEADRLYLEGSGPEGALRRLEILFADLAAVRIGRAPAERIGGRPSLTLERRDHGPVHIGEVEGLGVVLDLGHVLAELPERARNSRVAVVVPFKPESREQVQELVRGGPPFDPSRASLRGHHVYVSDREVVFVFEGPDVRRTIAQLTRTPAAWRAAADWHDCLAGRPRVAEEAYAWMGGAAPRD